MDWLCSVNWEALGTWAAVVLALWLALRDTALRRTESNAARKANSELAVADLIVEMLDGFQSLIELGHFYVRMRFNAGHVPAESDLLMEFDRGVLTLDPIPGLALTRQELAGIDRGLALAVSKLRSDSLMLNQNIRSMAVAKLPINLDRQALIAKVAPTVLPAIYHLGLRYKELGAAMLPFASEDAREYISGFNADVATDVVKFVLPKAGEADNPSADQAG